MLQTINLSSDAWSLAPFSDAGALREYYTKNGCQGIELILCGEEFQGKIQKGMIIGLHLVFYPEWICLWNNDFAYMDREFGGREQWQRFYCLKNRDELLDYYRHELEVAKSLGAQYVVYHMGDNALDEYFTLQARYTQQQQLDASCEFLNALFSREDEGLDLLLENMWLGCMNLTNPENTAYALSHIHYPSTGLMLDTGHLMCTNPRLKSQEEGCEYIHQILDRHGAMAQKIRGVHLHASLSGEYQSCLPLPPPSHTLDYLNRFAAANAHLRKIDLHQPFTAQSLPELIQRISPSYLCHELRHGSSIAEWEAALQSQVRLMDSIGIRGTQKEDS